MEPLSEAMLQTIVPDCLQHSSTKGNQKLEAKYY